MAKPGWGFFLLILFVLSLLSAGLIPCFARPKVIVVVADHLTFSDTQSDIFRDFPFNWSGLMSPGLASERNPIENVYATIGAGDTIRVGDVSQGLLYRTLKQAGLRVAVIGDADGDDIGRYRPMNLIAISDQPWGSGELRDPLAAGGVRIDPSALDNQTKEALGASDIVFVHFGDFSRIEREKSRGYLSAGSYRIQRQNAIASLLSYLSKFINDDDREELCVYLITPTAPLNSSGKWDSLTPVYYFSWPPISVMTSDTTQTDGLIAARDIAPSLLVDLGVPIPVTMRGPSIRGGTEGDGVFILEPLDRQTYLNQVVQEPVFWTLGLGGAAIVFIGIGLYLTRRLMPGSWNLRFAQYGLRLLAAWPLALLLAPHFSPHTVRQYLEMIAAGTAIIAFMPTPTVIWILTAIALIWDGATGTRLVSESVLSSYALAGIRFYGIGNEYMGLLIGGVLLAAGAMKKLDLHPLFMLLLFALATFVLSFPAFGAKAGGAITGTAAFTFAWLRLQGIRIKPLHILAALATGFGLIFLWAGVGHIVGTRHTHIDSAVGALGHGRFGYIVGVALRKIGLAVRVLVHPGTLWGLTGFVLVGLLARFALRNVLTEYFGRRPQFAAVFQAGLGGCIVAILFNDAGIVAAILLLSTLVLALLHGLFEETCAFSPSTSVMSESV